MASVHDLRSVRERDTNADGGSTLAAVVAFRRRGDGDRFPDE